MNLPFSLIPCLFLLLRIEADLHSSVKQVSPNPRASNASALLLNSTSSTLDPTTSSGTTLNMPFIIPYDNSQECNIYGPVCQTGSITVAVNLTTTATNTVLPCSSYLSTQSNYLLGSNNDDPEVVDGVMPNDWLVSFGHSPECRSYAREYKNGRYAISGCGDRNTVIVQNPGDLDNIRGDLYPTQIPPGLVRYIDPVYLALCCGGCAVDVAEVRLYYFPDSDTPKCHYNQTSNSSSILSSTALGKRVHSIIDDSSVAVLSGHTFTSPSVYLQILGTAVASDECTVIGPTLTSPIMSFPPGALSTWKPPPPSDFPYPWSFGVGNTWQDPNWAFDRGGYTFTPLTIKDLACPTWGLGRSTSADGSVVTTIGPPWLPLIAPPMEFFSLDQTWASLCTGFIQDRLDGPTLLLFDPPIALTPGLGLVPTVTPAPVPAPVPAPNNTHPTTVPEKQTAPSPTAAKPANSPTGLADPPTRTADAGGDPVTPALSTVAEKPANSPVGSADPPSGTVDAGQDPVAPAPSTAARKPANSPTVSADPPARTADAGGDPIASSSDAGDIATPADQADPSSPDGLDPARDPVDPQSGRENSVTRKADGTPSTPTDPKEPSGSAPQQGDSLQSPTPELGALIYEAFDKTEPGTGEVVNQKWVLTSDIGEISMGRGQVLSFDPSRVEFQGKEYSIDGSGITLSNSAFTVVVQEKSEMHTANINQYSDDALPTTTPTPPTLTIAGEAIAPNPTGFILNGATISPGGAAQTLDGTIISLEQSGTLIIGSSTIPLLAAHTRLPSLPTIQGESSLTIIDSMKPSLNTPEMSIISSMVSSETGAMPTGVGNASRGLAVFESGQRRWGSEPSLLFSLSVLVLGATLMALTI